MSTFQLKYGYAYELTGELESFASKVGSRYAKEFDATGFLVGIS